MDNVKSILDQLYDFWKRRSTFKALIFFILLTNFSLFSIFSFSYFTFDKVKLLETPEEFKNFVFVLAGIYGIINLSIILLWIYWRNVHHIPISGIGIIFAPHSDPECNDLVYRLYDQFKLDLEKRKPTDQITYKILPENRIVRNHDDAINLLTATGARLVIHGFVQKGKIKNEQVEGFKTISFTLRHRTLRQAERKPVMHALASALAYRKFTAYEKNSFFEKDVVIENISEVSCFFISMGLALDGKLESSRKILENVLINMEPKMKNPHRNPQLLIFL